MLLWIIAILFLLAVFCFVVDLVAQPKWRAVSAGRWRSDSADRKSVV